MHMVWREKGGQCDQRVSWDPWLREEWILKE